MICEHCGDERDDVTSGPACNIPHCGSCFWDCTPCLSDMADDVQGELHR